MATGDQLMYPVSQRFIDSLSGSHEMVARARVCTSRQTGTGPFGVEIPILGGDVTLSRTADVKRTLDLTVPGDCWDELQPTGAELFVERGIDFGDGTREYVPLGYFRVQDLEQQRAPKGPISVAGRDRNAQLMDHRRPIPVTIPDGSTHREVFEALVNAQPIDGQVYAYRPWGVSLGLLFDVPITWTGYDPDATSLNGPQVWDQSAYEFLAKLAESLDCVLTFGDDGALEIAQRDAPLTAGPSWTVTAGPGGNLLRAGRSVTREGTYNFVVAYGSDPSSPTGYRQVNGDVVGTPSNDPLRWDGRFGPVIRFYASPLIRTDAQGDAAATTVLARVATLGEAMELDVVPNPALRPNDLITVAPEDVPAQVRQVDQLTIPLVNGPSMPVKLIGRGGGGPTDDRTAVTG